MLTKMGAEMTVIGTDTLTIRKTDTLSGVEMRNDTDRIETGTFMIAAAMHPESDLTLTGCKPEDLGNFTANLKKTGVGLTIDGDTIRSEERRVGTEGRPRRRRKY